MMLGKLLSALLFSAPVYAKYLTITAGSSDVTTTHCKTLVALSSQKSVPTRTYTRTALVPEVVVVLGVSTPASTVTPPAITATDTRQTYTTTTITASFSVLLDGPFVTYLPMLRFIPTAKRNNSVKISCSQSCLCIFVSQLAMSTSAFYAAGERGTYGSGLCCICSCQS